jgi:hypothetical protein
MSTPVLTLFPETIAEDGVFRHPYLSSTLSIYRNLRHNRSAVHPMFSSS